MNHKYFPKYTFIGVYVDIMFLNMHASYNDADHLSEMDHFNISL